MSDTQIDAYLVFVMESRGDADTKLQAIWPRTQEAAEALREGVARVKQSWQSSQSNRISVGQEESSNGELGGDPSNANG